MNSSSDRPGQIIFVTGGCRSGKSSFAECTALQRADTCAYIATAEACDEEMSERIRRHRERRGERFHTIEAPLELAAALARAPEESGVVLIDCLTVWMGNLMHHCGEEFSEDSPRIGAFLDALESPRKDVVIVSNELGMGVVPTDARVRRFRDVAGRLNQRVAARADEVYLCVSGIPLCIKGKGTKFGE
ncbi:MAG: bifunctional adenosylcobinamide kinase/adenosylcobinamide-phosphate guanylyltransferase [Opitutales bacterium]